MPGVTRDHPARALALAGLLCALLATPRAHAQSPSPVLGTCTAEDADTPALWLQEIHALTLALRTLDRDTLLALDASTLTLTDQPRSVSGGVTLSAEGTPITLSFEQIAFAHDGAITLTHATLETENVDIEVGSLTLDRDRHIDVTDARASLRDGERRARIEAAALQIMPDTLRASLRDVTLSPCGCAESDSATDSIRLTALRVEADPDADRIELEGVSVVFADVGALALPVSDLHRDGRASGLLLPNLSFASALGFVAELPAFLRLSEHADLTAALGYATSRGPTARLDLRYHIDDANRGAINLTTRYDIDPGDVTLLSRGLLAGRLLRDLELLLEVDFLSDLRLHDELRRSLAGRAKRYGRSRAAFTWSTSNHVLGGGAEWLQQRPRRTQQIESGAFEPVLDGAPALQRLPSLRYSGGSALPGGVRLDLDARYALLTSTHGTPFLDWGTGGPERSVIGLEEPDAAAGDGIQDDDIEPTANTHHVAFDTAARWPIDLGGYGHLVLATGFSERSIIDNERAHHRAALDLGGELTTTLMRRFESGVHAITPSARWRSRMLTLGETSALPLPTLDPALTPHSLELRVDNRFTAPDWHLQADIGWVLFLGADTDALGLVQARIDWTTAVVRVEASLGLRVDDPSTPWWSLTGEVMMPAELTARVGHHAMGAGLWWWGSQPNALDSTGVWRRERLTSPLTERAAASVFELHWSPTFISANIQAALLHDRNAGGDLGVELGAGFDITGSCGCWRAGLRGARHANAPRWDIGARFELLSP